MPCCMCCEHSLSWHDIVPESWLSLGRSASLNGLQEMADCALSCRCAACLQLYPPLLWVAGLCALQIAFVPTASGDLMPPSQLYSPRDSELMALLNPQTSFPIGQEAHVTM